MTIGRMTIGYRIGDPHRWKNYLLPHFYITPQYKHEYYKFYIRFMNFFICKPRKCECCGKYMDSYGGTHIWNIEGDKKLITICRKCRENKIYIDKDGVKHTGYLAWLKEMWE